MILMDVTITVYPNASVTDRRAAHETITLPWANFAEYLESAASDRRMKGSAGYWVAAPVGEGPRTDSNTGATRVVALDWDDGPVDWSALGAYSYVAHTTDSHTEASPRWRVWILLDKEYAGPFNRFRCPWPGAHLRAISQPVYIPTMGEDTWWVQGPSQLLEKPLRLDDWTVAEAPAEPTPPPAPRTHRTDPSQASTNALVTRWLSRPEGTNRLAGATGAALAEWGWTDPEIENYLATWLSADPRLGKHTDDALRAAARRRAGDRIVGFPTLEAELGVPFAADATEEEDVSAMVLALDAAGSTQPEDSDDPFAPSRLTSASAIAAWDPPEIPWLVQALAIAPGAPALITGYGGSGKTTFVQHLALAIATPGALLLGAHEVRHGSVLHIDHEQGLDLTKRRYLRLGVSPQAQLDVVSFPRWSLADPDANARKHFLRAVRGRALVVIDSLLASTAAFLEDENASGTREPLDFLTRVSEATGACILVIHHSKKDRSERMTSARGTSAITDAVSVHMTYEREDPDDLTAPSTLALTKVRHERPAGALTEPTSIIITPRGAPALEGYTLSTGDSPAVRAEAAAGAVEDQAMALLTTGWTGNASALATELGRSKNRVLEVVRELIEAGAVERYIDGGRSKIRLAVQPGLPGAVASAPGAS
jgi:KaiC/GvpD/RAD55 family RecA-like ATPase